MLQVLLLSLLSGAVQFAGKRWVVQLPPQRLENVFLSILSHKDWYHYANNAALLVVAGGAYELQSGGLSTQAVFWVSAVTGVLSEATRNSEGGTLGMSAGTWGLFAAGVGYLALNWNEARHKTLYLLLLLLFLAANGVAYFVDGEGVAHIAHVAGGVSGIFVSGAVSVNRVVHPHELWVRLVSLALATFFLWYPVFLLSA